MEMSLEEKFLKSLYNHRGDMKVSFSSKLSSRALFKPKTFQNLDIAD